MPRLLPFLLAATLALTLSACGRKGALEAPTVAPPAKGEEPAPVEDKPFILDRLIQ